MVAKTLRREVLASTTTRVHLTGKDIVQLLVDASEIEPGGFEKLTVTFNVPTGGDYSGMTLDMLQDCDLTVDVEMMRTTHHKEDRQP